MSAYILHKGAQPGSKRVVCVKNRIIALISKQKYNVKLVQDGDSNYGRFETFLTKAIVK